MDKTLRLAGTQINKDTPSHDLWLVEVAQCLIHSMHKCSDQSSGLSISHKYQTGLTSMQITEKSEYAQKDQGRKSS